MTQQTLIWTALPNGYTTDGKSLRMSVMLSPRLVLNPATEQPVLSTFFPDWEDWPSVLKTASFKVTINGKSISFKYTATTGISRVDDELGFVDSSVWKALFNRELPVRPYAYNDLSSNTILSYDTAAMSNKIMNIYKTLATNANDNMPLVRDFLTNPDWKELIGTIRALDSSFSNEETGLRDPLAQFEAYKPPTPPKIKSLNLSGSSSSSGNIIPNTEDNSVPTNFNHFQLFHTPSGKPGQLTAKRKDDQRIESSWLNYNRQKLPEKDKLAKQLDFHQIVSIMGSYPTLLRKFGLVVDLLLDPKKFTTTTDGKLSVEVKFPANSLKITTNHIIPVTHVLLSSDQFRAITNPSSTPGAHDDFQIENGLLKLEKNQFELLQMDVDSAGLKVMNFARSLGRRHYNLDLKRLPDSNNLVNPVTLHEDEIGAPSLRTGGLMLAHKNRKNALKNRFSRNTASNSTLESQLSGQTGELSLYAEDLVRGFRFDIWDSKTKSWHSLCRRSASYLLGNGVVSIDASPVKVEVDSEETTIRLAATKSADQSNTTISDFLYLHEIMASWTGWSMAAPPPGRALSPDDSVDKTRLQSEAEVPPGLKFKSSFKPIPHSLPRLRFGRSYWIRARVVDIAGNSLAPQSMDFDSEDPVHNAIPYFRFEPIAAPIIALLSQNGTIEQPAEGESMSCIGIRSFNDTPADNTVPSNQITHRAVVPPRVSVREAEQHGKLDSAAGKVDSSTFNLLAHQKDIDPRDNSAAVSEEKISSQGPLGSNPVDTTYAVYEGGRQLTYLPDPMAVEVAVRIFDHPNINDTDIIFVPLYPTGDWPEAQPFLIEVYEDSSQSPHFVADRRVLRVPLPKAVRAKIRLSMKLSNDDLDKLAIFALLENDDKDKQRQRVLNGQHWMLTPWNVVEVVHAVQRPLIAPEIRSLTIEKREIGVTFARPIIVTSCSINSSDRLDLLSEWHEPLDNAEQPESTLGPADRSRRDIAFSIKITDTKQYATRLNGFAFGGIPDHTIENQDVIGINTNKDNLSLKAHEFHDSRYRRIEYWFDATTRFREYLPESLLTILENGERIPVENHIKVTGPRAVTWIPNSTPPSAPKVLYIVPTFGWIRTTDSEHLKSSWRRGGSLRVYLDRPWNVSGYGEMLAVVLPPANFAGDPDNQPKENPYKKYVTQWGNDPIWDSPFVSGIAPKRNNFPLARFAPDASGDWLPPGAPESEKDQKPGAFEVTQLLPPSVLQESGADVEIAPHDVFYDAERQLWYCDIEIEAGASYFPFVRLALARYQPISSTGAHLSNIVLADFMALTADRWLVVMPTPTDSTSYHVAVFGVSYKESSAHHEATHSPAMSEFNPLTGQVTDLTPVTVAESSVVEVWVEKLDTRLGEDFGWQRITDFTTAPLSTFEFSPQAILSGFKAVTNPQTAQESLADSGLENQTRDELIDKLRAWQKLWEGEVVLPDHPNEYDHYRLVIAEYEEYLIDDDRPYDRVPTQKDRRLVFVEHVELL
jgi:hypothetical protein